MEPQEKPQQHTHWYLHNKAWPLWVLRSEVTSRCIHVLRSKRKSSSGQELNDVNNVFLPHVIEMLLSAIFLSSRLFWRQMTAIANVPCNYRFGGALHFTYYPRQHKPELSGCQVRECPWQKSSGNSADEFEVPTAWKPSTDVSWSEREAALTFGCSTLPDKYHFNQRKRKMRR